VSFTELVGLLVSKSPRNVVSIIFGDVRFIRRLCTDLFCAAVKVAYFSTGVFNMFSTRLNLRFFNAFDRYTVASKRILKWGSGHTSGAKRWKKFSSCPFRFFGSTSTISRFGERFRDGQYSLAVSFIVFCMFFYSRRPRTLSSGCYCQYSL